MHESRIHSIDLAVENVNRLKTGEPLQNRVIWAVCVQVRRRERFDAKTVQQVSIVGKVRVIRGEQLVTVLFKNRNVRRV